MRRAHALHARGRDLRVGAVWPAARRWHTADVMGIGGTGPKDASPDDLKGWSSTQVGGRAVEGRWPQSCPPACLPKPAALLPRHPRPSPAAPAGLTLHLLRLLCPHRTPQVVAFLDKLAELRALQPLHPTITRKCAGRAELCGQASAGRPRLRMPPGPRHHLVS